MPTTPQLAPRVGTPVGTYSLERTSQPLSGIIATPTATCQLKSVLRLGRWGLGLVPQVQSLTPHNLHATMKPQTPHSHPTKESALDKTNNRALDLRGPNWIPSTHIYQPLLSLTWLRLEHRAGSKPQASHPQVRPQNKEPVLRISKM